jgi:hypothetical protein
MKGWRKPPDVVLRRERGGLRYPVGKIGNKQDVAVPFARNFNMDNKRRGVMVFPLIPKGDHDVVILGVIPDIQLPDQAVFIDPPGKGGQRYIGRGNHSLKFFPVFFRQYHVCLLGRNGWVLIPLKGKLGGVILANCLNFLKIFLVTIQPGGFSCLQNEKFTSKIFSTVNFFIYNGLKSKKIKKNNLTFVYI